MEAGLYFARKNNSRLTIEYILVSDVNDTQEAAKDFVKLLKRSAKPKDEVQVNLIPFNETGSKNMATVPESNLRFKNFLIKNKILAMICQSRGADIGSACGQLGL